jgi:RNA-binding protein
MDLSGRQKRFLRGLGQTLHPTLMVGKEGMTEGIRTALDELLAHHELVKVRVQKGAGGETRDWAEQVVEGSGAALVGVVGHTFLVYRPNPELKERIRLPEE